MPDARDAAQVVSDGTALIVTVVAAALFCLTAGNFLERLLPAPARRDPGLELSLQFAPPEARPLPPPPAPPPPRMRRVPVEPALAPVVIEPPPVASEAPPADAVLVAAPAPPSAQPGDSHPDLEAQYAAALRADIDARTRPPDTIQYRLRRPSGEVRVRFVLRRSGEVEAVALLRSAGSPILDEAALNIVSSGHYPPMPAKAFVGEAHHVFVVTIEFRPA
ncbi:MAG: energy transducer TonB [Gammaproteobacteria bacterium]|nr:energy transducer TonB [Gammaproteobacteria bacterium]